MRARSHLLCAAGALALIHLYAHAAPKPLELAAYLIGTLAPDIDGDGLVTRPGRLLPTKLGRVLGAIADTIGMLLSKSVRAFVTHRGLLHWPLLPSLALVLLPREAPWAAPAWWFAVGYLIHLVCDFVTIAGIPVFAPLSFRRYGVALLRTGSIWETLLALLIAGAALRYAIGT